MNTVNSTQLGSGDATRDAVVVAERRTRSIVAVTVTVSQPAKRDDLSGRGRCSRGGDRPRSRHS